MPEKIQEPRREDVLVVETPKRGASMHYWPMLLCLGCAACTSATDPLEVGVSSDGGIAATDSETPGEPGDPADAEGLGDTSSADANSRDTEPTPDGGAPRSEDVVCFDEPLEVFASGEGFEVSGPHYRLYAESGRERAEETARMLEAAWFAFDAYFGVAPEVGPDEELRVKVYSTRERWVTGMARDGLEAPGPPAGGYFDPDQGTAYLYIQPTVYYTDSLTLHEAAHQFHWRGPRVGGQLPSWYEEGLAEYLSRHDWDGRCVRLGVRPLLSQEDYPAEALSQIEAVGIDLADIVDAEATPSRAVAWAVVAFLETGLGGALADGFAAFRAALDGGSAEGHLAIFEREIGVAAELEGPLREWLQEAQLLMSPVRREWTHRTPDALWGHGANFSFALFRQPLEALSAEARPGPGPWGLGVITEYLDEAHYTGVVLFDDGRVSTFEMIDGSATWWAQGEVSVSALDIPIEVEIVRGADDTARVRFGESSFEFETTMPPVLGLVVNDSDVHFESLRWR